MNHIQANQWPLIFICAAMILSAVIDWWKFKVPNWLTFPIIFSGWAFGLIHTLGYHLVPGDGIGGIGSALAGTAVGSLLLLAYAIGGMGAGDVKMCMGFGAWIGAYYGIEGGATGIILIALCVGIMVGGVIALIMIALRMQFRQNLEHTRVILMDLVTTGSLSMIAQKAHERRPRWHRLPYGVPLCIGFVVYLWYAQPELPSPSPTPEDPQGRLASPIAPFSTVCRRDLKQSSFNSQIV